MSNLQLIFLAINQGNGTYQASLGAGGDEGYGNDFQFAVGILPVGPDNLGNFSYGAPDHPNSIFSDYDDAANFYYTNNATSYLNIVNSAIGSTVYTSSTLVKYPNNLSIDLATKQPLDTGLTALSGAVSSPYGRSLLNTANQAALQTEVGVSIAGLSGDYTDLSNKPSIPSVTRTTSTLSLSLVGNGATGTQISSTKDSTVRATVSTSTTSTIGGPSTSVVALKICATNDSTEGNWTTVATFESDQTITLALVLNSVQVVKGQITADVPAGYYVKLVNSGTGTHSETFVSGQKTTYG